MSYAIGIDLGTTFSVVSVYKNDKVEIIPNKYGNRTTPSIVAYDKENNVYVGEVALDNSGNIPSENIIHTVKRKIGSSFKYQINNLNLSPEIISSEILKYLKQCAEEYLGESVFDAVITVPAYFNNDQRQATKLAGKYAGLNVLRIINEPTAASLAYGLDNKKDSTILVYDLGGGTFDVTLLKLTDGIDFHVLATSGNTKLGGVDFDKAIYDIIFDKSLKSHTDFDKNFSLNLSQYNKLIESCEKAKKALSLSQKAMVYLPYLAFNGVKPFSVNEFITREEFQNAILPHINLTKDCIDLAINDAKLQYTDIDEVVFVGGSTRIPLVFEKVYEWTGKKPNKSINPDEAVSIGAAIQASVLSGNTDKEVYLVDVTPLSLGIETQGGFMNVMIKRNTQVPAEYTEIFTTANDNQTSVDVKVFQGERPQTSNNYFLGEFKLDNIKKAVKGVPKIEVAFSIDSNGILSVSAIDQDSNISKTLVLENDLSNYDIVDILKDAEENKISDELFKQIMQLRNWLQDYLVQISQLLESRVIENKEIDELLDLQTSIESDINSENLELLNSLVHSSKEIIEEISAKVYKEAEKLVK